MIDKPDIKHVSTSQIECQNLTMRMNMRRFTLIHKSLRVTPAMEAGVSNHVWSVEEIAELLN